MPKEPKRSPAEVELPFEYDFEHPAEEVLTGYAGIPLFVRAVRSFAVPGSVKRQLHLKQRQRGFDEATYVESFLVLNAPGGECLEEEGRPEGAGPLRYVAIRVRKRQGELFSDGSEFRYFVVATNQWEGSAKKLLEWHREKAASIEALHDVLKNELAAAVMPCGRFGANAAWLRLALLTHNVLTGLKRIALRPEWLEARPKRLRFHFFFSPGRLIHHARRLLARVGRRAWELLEWAEAWRLLPAPS